MINKKSSKKSHVVSWKCKNNEKFRLEPGYKKFIIDPHPVDLTSFYLKTPIPNNRTIEVEYKDNKLTITVPQGCCAVYNNNEYNTGIHVVDFV